MFNSKFSGQQVEALLDKVSGSTIGGVSQEQFDSAEHVVTASLVSLNNRVSTLESNSGSTGGDSYDDSEVRALISGNTANILALSGKTVSYNDLTDKPSLFDGDYNSLANKPSIPEAYNDSELRGLISGNTQNIEALSGRTVSYNDLTDKPTIPTLPTFATINGSAITEGGDIVIEAEGGVSEERFDGLDKATAIALTRIVDQYMTTAKAEETYAKSNNVYTKTESEAKFIDQSELTNALVAFMRSDAYHSIHDPQEKAIAAALNNHNDRITILESGSTGGEEYDDTELRTLLSGHTEAIEALSGKTVSYEDLTDKPTLFDGDYNSLTNKPTIPTFTINNSAVTDGSNIEIHCNFDEHSLDNCVTVDRFESAEEVTSAAINDLNKRINALSGSTSNSYDDSDVRALISGNTANIAVLSGRTVSYNDLTDKPSIPSAYNDTDVRNLISGNTVDIAALLARIEVLEAQLSGVTAQLDNI